MIRYRDNVLNEKLMELFSEEQLAAIEEHFSWLWENDTEGSAEDYDEVAPIDAVNSIYIPKAYTVPLRAHMRANSKTPALNFDTDVENDGIETSKRIEKTEDGYNLILEAYTTGKITQGSAKPSDIVLVVDMSTSMKSNFSESGYSYREVYDLNKGTTYYLNGGTRVVWCNRCNAWTNGCSLSNYPHRSGTVYLPKTSADDSNGSHVQFYNLVYQNAMTRLEALKQAAKKFINKVADQSTDDRIAIVGFGQSVHYRSGNGADSALLDATDNRTKLINSIDGINNSSLEAATEHGRGMDAAKSVFDSQPSGTYDNRNKIVVMITDGEPAPRDTSKWSSRVVKQAVNTAYDLKQNGTVIYTVSVMPGTNAENPTSNMDKYMSYVSSNYPNARYTGNEIDNRNKNGDSYYSGSESDIIEQITPGNKVDTSNGSYYLTAGNIDTLESIFGQIADQTGGASISLGEGAVLFDRISDEFRLPDGVSTDDIEVATEDAYFDGSSLMWRNTTAFSPSIIISGKEIYVSGFDFDRNFVAENGRVEGDVSQEGDFHGRKLIVTIPIVVESSTFGGNNIPTNGDDSGIYDENGVDVENFTSPTVDVKLKYEIDKNDKTIYLGNDTNVHDLLAYAAGYTPDGDNNKYVDITYTIKDKDGNLVGTYKIPAKTKAEDGTWEWIGDGKVAPEDCTDYTIECEVKADHVTESRGSDYYVHLEDNESLKLDKEHNKAESATIHVLKPTITAMDIWANYGTGVDLGVWSVDRNDDDVLTVKEWTDGSSHTYPDPEGNAPAVSLAEVKKVSNTDGTLAGLNYMTGADDSDFDITKIKINDKTFDKSHFTVVRAVENEEHDFTVHINHFDLTVTKEVTKGDTSLYGNTFVFTVTDNEGNKEIVEFVLKKDESKKITGLLCGKEYTVSEDTNWSWRYKATSNGTFKVSGNKHDISNDPVDTCHLSETVTNELKSDKWLTDEKIKTNTFKSGLDVATGS